VAIRAVEGVLILHTLFFADEVRPRPTVSGETRQRRPEEIKLARRLKGGAVAGGAPAAPRQPVVNFMDALKAPRTVGGRQRTSRKAS